MRKCVVSNEKVGTEAPKESISVGMNGQWIVILKKEDKSMSELL